MSKYLTLLSCCLIHLVIGSVYADSALYQAIVEFKGWERGYLVGGFAITIVALGCSAAAYRKYFNGMDYKTVLCASAAMYALSSMVIWLSILAEHPLELAGYWTGCAVRGGHIGIMYAITVTSVTELFPKRRGLYSGLVVMSFGVGSWIAAQIYAYILQFPLQNMILVQISYWGALFIASGLFNYPKTIHFESVKSIVQNPVWQRLSLVFFLNICVGVTILSNLVTLTVEHGISYEQAIQLVGLAGIANGLGRIVYSAISDEVGKLEVLRGILVLQTICLVILPWCWEVAILGIISVYGGGFALMPSICAQYLADGSNGYSALLFWWGIAGLVAPMLFLVAPYTQLLVISSILAYCCVKDTRLFV